MAETPDGTHLATAAAALTDDEVRALAGGLGAGDGDVLARALGIPGAALRRSPRPATLLATRLARGPLALRVEAARLLVQACIDDTVRALGDRYEDPSRADMLEVLPGVLESHGPGATRLMLASYVVPDAKAAAVFAELLATDARLAPPGAPAAPEADTTALPVDDAPPVVTSAGSETDTAADPDPRGDDADREAQRRRRKDAKEARRAEQRAATVARERGADALREARRRAKRA